VPHWRERYDRFGPVSWERVLGLRVVTLLGPDATGLALVNRDQAFANSPGARLAGPFFRRGLNLLDFDEHRHHRRILFAAFTNDRLRAYLARMNPSIERGIASWQPSEAFQAYPALKRLTLDIATEVLMGDRLGPEADRVNAALFACVRAPSSVVRLPVPGLRWSRGLAGRRYLEDFLQQRLPAKRAEDGADLFSRLCHAESEDGVRFTDADVVNHMILIMVASHDTSAITMTAMLYYLAKHPEWQERCRQESLAIGTPAADRTDLGKLTSLDLVMKEALRLVAPGPVLMRGTVEDTDVFGHFVPAGALVIVVLGFTHHMHEYWPDPQRFDPERFAEHRREDKVHPYAWEPFGGGPHKCIGLNFAGMQVKAVMHQLLQRYRWSVPPGYQMSLDPLPVPIPTDGLPVRLERIT
jgi:cytochrome P450